MRITNEGDMSGGQWRYANAYCPKCKSTGASAHATGCDGEKVVISSTARFPKKDAPQKAWDKFYEKFVEQSDLKEKQQELEHDRLQENRRLLGVLRRKRISKNRKSLDSNKGSK